MQPYLCDGIPIPHEQFVRRALDPGGSAIVEACAGSGKTWLLVGRIVRLLLTGIAPGRILAITFTRRAAQQMRERLLQDLALLARAEDGTARELLRQRGLAPGEAEAALPAARGLYEKVASAEDSIGIDTFHGWFWRILRGAPLGSGVPHTANLTESTRRLFQDAWSDFAGSLLDGQSDALVDYEALVRLIGDSSAALLLRNFVGKRTEWWSFAGLGGDGAVDQSRADRELRARTRACAPMRAALRSAGFADDRHPALSLRQGPFCAILSQLLASWREADRRRISERKPSVLLRQAIEAADSFLLAEPSPDLDLAWARQLLLTGEGTPRAALEAVAIAGRNVQADPAYAQRLAQAHWILDQVQQAQVEWEALSLNLAGLRCGVLLLQAYEARKRQANCLDFVDIEWFADRLLGDEQTAAYMQAQLDSRYRHLLIDEFQDTSTLQWRVLSGWLGAYGDTDDGQAPSVFVVGDPKQSIYRFRRAEPLVFEAARRHLKQTMGACDLRTHVTRRNPRELVDLFDAVFEGRNPLYQAHASLAGVQGHFQLLPLADAGAGDGEAVAPEVAAPDAEAGSACTTAAPAPRDPLSRGREEPADDVHEHEGRQLARALTHWVCSLQVPTGDGSRAASWKDAIVLVRRRRHLAALERALRQAGIPTRSDRKGGLLASPEVEDLVALLDFLCTRDDLSLAHALRSPILGCEDADLIAIARRTELGWWEKLVAMDREATPPSAALRRARSLLCGWLQGVGVLPVHDLLDRIFDTADLRAAYAARMPAPRWPQIQANLDAFLELALTLDAGRFPTLTRFLDELQSLQADEEALDEGLPPEDDAVRLMTIHGAKGLEAPIVAIADTNAGEGPDDRCDVLLAWPPQQAAPEHFSLIGRAGCNGSGRGAWLRADADQREQEDWNLMYVALTRARQVLIVSGSKGRGSAGNWYQRLLAVRAPAAPDAANVSRRPGAAGDGNDANTGPAVVRTDLLQIQDFRPAPHATGARTAATRTEATRLGQAWHALLERYAGRRLPADAGGELAAEFGVTPEQARLAVQAALRVTSAPSLARFFDTGAAGWNELDLVDPQGAALRIDRLVELEDAIWILDYKWSCSDEQRPGYEGQLERYAAAVAARHPGRTVRTALVLADATLLVSGAQPVTDKIPDGGPPRIEAP